MQTTLMGVFADEAEGGPDISWEVYLELLNWTRIHSRGVPSNCVTLQVLSVTTIMRLPFDMVLPFDNFLLQAQICNFSPNSFFCIFVLPLWTIDINFE